MTVKGFKWLVIFGLFCTVSASLGRAATVSEGANIESVVVLSANPNLESTDYAWGEVAVSGHGAVYQGPHLVFDLGIAGLGRVGQSPGGEGSGGMIRVNALSLNGLGLVGGRLDVSLGRVELRFGEGFLLADGVSEATYFDESQPWSNPWHDFDALHVKGESEGILMETFVAKRSGGALLGGDARWALPFAGPIWGEGGASLLALVRQGSPRQMASIRGQVGLSGGSLLGELAFQGGSDSDDLDLDNEVARFAGAGYLKGRWDVPTLPVPMVAEGGLFFYSGDGVRSARNEAWDPLFQGESGMGKGGIGLIAPQLPGYKTDQLTGYLQGSAELAPRHSLDLLFLSRFTHRGTAQCLDLTGNVQCVQSASGTATSVGTLVPMLMEVDLSYGYAARRGYLEGSRHSVTMAYAKPLRGSKVEAFSSNGGTSLLMGELAAFAIFLSSSAAF